MRWCRRFFSATPTSPAISRGWSSAKYSECITRQTTTFIWWGAPTKTRPNSSNRRKPSSPTTTVTIVASVKRSSQLSLLSRTENNNRPNKYNPLFPHFGLEKIAFPVKLEDIPASDDKLAVNLNVYSILADDGKSQHPLYVS